MFSLLLACTLGAPLGATVQVTAEVVEPVSLYFVTLKECPGCVKMKPVVERLRKFYTVNEVDGSTGLGKQIVDYFGLDAAPAFVVYVKGKPARHFVGVMTEKELDGKIRNEIDEPYRQHRKEWRWSAGSCGMIGCAIHGAQWMEVDVKTEISAEPNIAPQNSGCPSCGKGLFRGRR